MKKLLIAVLFVAFAGFAGWMAWQTEQPYRGATGSQIVLIEPGSGALAIARTLVSHGVIAHQAPFLFRTWLGRQRGRTLKSGEYRFDRPLRPVDVYWKLARGEVYLHAVVIPEGSDRFDMARLFSSEIAVDPQEFLAATGRADLVRDLDPKAPSLEGYLFPDTYRFARGAPVNEIVQTMLARFRKVAREQLRLNLNPPPANLHDVITLASLVEKETPDPAERSMIAGVFSRRLEKGMPLQCDPSVMDALRLIQGFSNLPSGALSHHDLAVDSPYNTYLHAGLPPGPICSPGAASIRAALHPASGNALYFVSNNHGGHYFAKTLAEHNRNVTQYRRELKAGSPSDVSPSQKPDPQKPIGHRKAHIGKPLDPGVLTLP